VLRGRFSGPLDPAAERLSESTSEDRALLGVDLWGSMAHARMLGSTGILPAASVRRILAGLRRIAKEAAAGRFPLVAELEDVHLNVERALTDRIGRDGGRLHTGRSRNDQVATDLALFEREALLALEDRLDRVVASLIRAARRPSGHRTVDGWTHLQPAQRLYWGSLLGAHAMRFERDVERLAAVRSSIQFSPLGSGALAGSSLPLDRRRTARLLGFDRPHPSSVAAVSDRDAAIETVFALALAQTHASQLAEELVIGSMAEVGRVRFSDPFVTTSSLMPHKRNPDLAELVRAESAAALGRLTAHLALVRSLPIGYQRDLQAGKPILIESVRRAMLTFEVLAPMVLGAEYLGPPPADRTTASVELADALVVAGVPFREAHARVARFVQKVGPTGASLDGIPPSRFEAEFPELRGRGFRWPRADDEPDRRTVEGGSSRTELRRLLTEVGDRRRRARARADRERRRLRRLRQRFGLPERLFQVSGRAEARA